MCFICGICLWALLRWNNCRCFQIHTWETHSVLSWNVITLTCLLCYFRDLPRLCLEMPVVSLDSASPHLGCSSGQPSRTNAIPFLRVPTAHGSHAPQHEMHLLPPGFPLLPWGFKSFEGRACSSYSQSLATTDLTVHKCLLNKSMTYPPSMV